MERLTHTPQPKSHKLPPSSTVACPLDKNHRAHTKTVGPQPEMSVPSVKLGLPATLHSTSSAAAPYTFNSLSLDPQPETSSIELPMQKKMSPPPKSSLPVDNCSTHGSSKVGGTFLCSPEDIRPLPKITGPRAAASAAKKKKRRESKERKEQLTPHKKTLEEGINARKEKEENKSLTHKRKKDQGTGRIDVTNQPRNIKTEKEKISTEKRKRMVEVTETSLKSSENDDCPYLFCGELYKASMDGEGWSRCYVCHKWAHDA
ncbi:hypothetical protein PR048_028968 [Dryococelus australis]|uniref:Uncharacterized protein n=1 Tax=Dryococelus australis TaxID=614101 RepID=A0ABQ9GCM6_9NEOP|nr:hypothetical protein PR048_028968 [Dryococelus australis]